MAGLHSTTSSANCPTEYFLLSFLGQSFGVLVNLEAEWVVAFVIGAITNSCALMFFHLKLKWKTVFCQID
jgi:hypothetical protein